MLLFVTPHFGIVIVIVIIIVFVIVIVIVIVLLKRQMRSDTDNRGLFSHEHAP